MPRFYEPKKQAAKVYDVILRDGTRYKVHSRNSENMTLGKKFKQVHSVSDLNEGQIYYVKGLNGRIVMSTVFDTNGPEENYIRGIEYIIERGAMYVIPEVKPKVKFKEQHDLF